eukprot:gene44350-55155_t
MASSTKPVHIVGGGLAGSEAAWQLAQAGVPVVLHEMRPVRGTEAHLTDSLAELVCSNSFRSDDAANNAVGVIHEEMRRAGSLIMRSADAHKLPAGGALAVDRHGFSAAVQETLLAHPLVTLELHSPGPVDTVDEAYDITIVTSKHPLDGDFVARRLARTEVIMCASPEYLDKRGRPQHPRDLAHHDALLPPMSDLQRGISLTRVSDGEVINLAPHKPVLSASHIDTNYSAALHGLGIAGLPSFLAEDALMEQALERVLPEWQLYHFTIWAALPTRKYMPARTRAFLDFLLEIFGGEDRDPWLAAAGCETSLIEARLREAAAQVFQQVGQRRQFDIARADLDRIREEARQVDDVAGLAIAIVQAAIDAQDLQVALQT